MFQRILFCFVLETVKLQCLKLSQKHLTKFYYFVSDVIKENEDLSF